MTHQVRSFTNAKMGKVLELVGCFSNEWKEELQDATEGELKDAIDSVVSNRRQIAHGQGGRVGDVGLPRLGPGPAVAEAYDQPSRSILRAANQRILETPVCAH